MKTNRTRTIGSAIAGTGVAALVVAGMAFGMPSFDDEADPKLTESARARQQLLQRAAAKGRTLPWQPSDATRAKTGEQVLPAQAAGSQAAPAAAVVAQSAAAPPVAAPAASGEPTSQASPVAEGQGSWAGDDEGDERYEQHEDGDDDHEQHEDHEGDEHEGGDDD